MSRVLVIDDHGLYRKGLRTALEASFPNFEVLEACSLEAALVEIKIDPNLDLVLVDLHMPSLVPFKSLRELRECCLKARFLVLSASNARVDVLNCLSAGFHGYVSKLQPEDEIINAVKQVLDGHIYVPSWLAHIGLPGSAVAFSNLTPGLNCEGSLAKLTRRQREVLPLLARGMSNKEIARTLNIAEATTKVHAAALCRVLGVRNRTEAAAAARTFLK
jgi:DNA-binding NarL/FixJ family response regulator